LRRHGVSGSFGVSIARNRRKPEREQTRIDEEAMAMPKKASAKATKKSPRGKKAASTKSTKSVGAARQKQRAAKYEQPGAPWWKQHLPQA
jgi:hypothetical protein